MSSPKLLLACYFSPAATGYRFSPTFAVSSLKRILHVSRDWKILVMGCSGEIGPGSPDQFLDGEFHLVPGRAAGASQRGAAAGGWAPGHRHCCLCWETPGNDAAAKAGEERVPTMIIQIGENEME